ncbi:MAG: FAD-dependent oxidoreductase [Candidatus Bipolaricaulia bacterium]
MTTERRTIVIVGGVAGGASAAARARRMDESAEIIMLEKDQHVSFANCGLPYYIGGEIPNRDSLLIASPERFCDWFRVDARTCNEALAIDREQQTLNVWDRAADRCYDQPYDRLILAPGATPIVPPFAGSNAPNVFTLRNVADTDGIKSFIDSKHPRRAAVVGAGYIGLEMVEMLHGLGIEVTLIELMEQVMPIMDPDMAGMVESELARQGIDVRLGNGLAGFSSSMASPSDNPPVDRVHLQDGSSVDVDMAILGIGVKPHTSLAERSNLEIGPSGGIAVNNRMQTSDPTIYAVGDAVEYSHGVTGQPARVPLAGPANRAGRIAGEHAARDDAPAMAPVFGTAIVRVFDTTAAMTGLSEQQAADQGYDAQAVWVPAKHHAGYYPGAETMTVKLVFARGDGRVLGAQVVGGAGVDKRIDVLASALYFRATVDDLASLDLAYAPPFGAAKDPIHLAAFVAQNVHSGMDREVPPYVTTGVDGYDGDVQWLDVRDPDEWGSGCLEDAIRIPLGELRERLNELDPNRPVVTVCGIGQRAYFATRLLRQQGFSQVATLSGGMMMQRAAATRTVAS